MYLTTCMCILLIVIFLVIAKEKNVTNPIVIFSGIWLTSLFLSSLDLFGMSEISNKAIRLIFLGILSFIFGATIFYIYKVKIKKNKNNNNKKEFYIEKINFNIINILLILGIIFVLPVAVKVTGLLIKGTSYSDIRGMYYSYGDKESLINNQTIYTLFDWGTSIILTSITPIIITGLFYKKINRLSIINLIIFTLLYMYSTAGRTQLFIIIIEIILVFFINKRKNHKFISKIIWSAIAVITLLILIMSVMRNTSQEDIINQAYAYFSLPAPYFSKLINYVDTENINTSGVATFYGPYLLVQKTVKILTGYKLPKAEYYFDVINKPQNYWVKIFEESSNYYNAYATMFYNFYLDYREVGVILFSVLYGILIEKIYLDAILKKNIINQVFYLVFMIGICNSFIRWQFASPTVLMSVVLIKILIRSKKNNEIKKVNDVNIVNSNRVLVFGMTENPGGIESVIMNYYRKIDKNFVEFDFLCNTQEVAYEEEIKKIGGKIYRITPRSKSKIQFSKDMKEFFSTKSSQYSAIWVNVCSLANIDYLKYAKKYGIKKRIIHSHNSQNMDSFIRGLLHRWNKIFLKKYATDFWSCSEEASKWFYNKKIMNCSNYRIIRNAIDFEKYSFNQAIGLQYKKELGLENKIVIGNIGRLHFQKNQEFLVEIFYELSKLNDKFAMILVGDGEDYEKINQKIHYFKLENSIKLLGVRNDVNNIFQAMDVLVFPSRFEGLPLVLIEAQANGLPIFASDTITNKVKMSENIKFISLERTAKEWANIIFEDYKKNNFLRADNYKNIVNNGYEINYEVKKLEKYFEGN